jgi:hypothetical protein
MHADTIDTMEPAPKASVGPTLLGGIIGAAVGVGLHLVLETGILGTRPVEASWFAIVIGLLTGLGVRQANKHHMERSYLRGAISGFVALGAIVASTYLISQVMSKRDALSMNKPAAVAAAADKEDAAAKADGEAAATAEPAVQPAAEARGPAATGVIGRRGPEQLNPWQFVFMALGALVAYEFGRGIDHSRRIAVAEPVEPMPTATNPAD